MASPNDTTRSHEGVRAQNDVASPFIAFRRFADEQMSSLLNLAFGPNSYFSNSSITAKGASQDWDAWSKETCDPGEERQREEEETASVPDLYTSVYRNASDGEKSGLLKQIVNENEPLRCSYGKSRQKRLSSQELRDLVAYLRADTRCPSLPRCIGPSQLHSDLLLSHMLGPSGPGLALPSPCILQSRDSLIQLEQHKSLSDLDTVCRKAFEDLLSVPRSRGLSNRSSTPSYQAETPSQWVSNIATLAMSKGKRQLENPDEGYLEIMSRDTDNCSKAKHNGHVLGQDAWQSAKDGLTNSLFRLSLERAFPTAEQKQALVTNASTNRTEGDADKDNEGRHTGATELDLYEHFLKTQQSPSANHTASTSRIFAHLEQDSSAMTETNSKESSPLSMLTITEKTTLQDGATHTKVVRKKQFSDGREERTETVCTQNALPRKSTTSVTEDTSKQEGGRNGENDKRGWFWS